MDTSMAPRPKFTVTLDEDVFKKLERQAKKEGRTNSNLAAYIITMYFQAKP